jgi:hypothetical protein
MRNQMQVLNQTIADSAHERQVVLAQCLQHTQTLLRGFGLARVQAAKELRGALTANREERSQEVCALLFEANASRVAYGQELQQAMQRQATALRQDRRARYQEVASLLDTFRRDNLEMSNQMSASLFEQGANRSQEVSELIDGFRVAREHMAKELSESLGDSVRATHDALATLLELRHVITLPLKSMRAEKATIPNYLLSSTQATTSALPKVSTHSVLSEEKTSSGIDSDDVISVAVRRAQEPHDTTAQRSAAIENAFSSVSERSSSKALAKSKKK